MGRVCRIIIVCVLLVLSFLFLPHLAFAAEKVLILDSTVNGGINSLEAQEAAALGFSVEVVDNAGWAAKTTSDFASYRGIILGDPISIDISKIAAAEANKFVWGQAITGNVVVIGTDPVLHNYSSYTDGPRKLIKTV